MVAVAVVIDDDGDGDGDGGAAVADGQRCSLLELQRGAPQLEASGRR